MYVCVTKKRSHQILAGAAVAIAGAITLGCFAANGAASEPEAAVVSSTIEWGLSFQEENAPPIPNLPAEEMRPYDGYYNGDASQKRLYLTYDAGYDNGNTVAILDAMKKHGVTGAFFIVGTYVKEYPDLVKRMVDEGHIVGNHTYHHPNMSQQTKEKFTEELLSMEKIFQETTGTALGKFYRPPEGKFTIENLQWAQELGYKTVLWSTAYVDWHVDNQPSREKAFSTLMPRIHDGSILLLHSTSATNAAILDELIERCLALGYTFGTLDELGQTPVAQSTPATSAASTANA